MKNTLKYFLLIALGFIALYACQQDGFQVHSVHNHENTDRFKRKKVSLEDIENKEVIQKKIETLFSKNSFLKYKTTSTINQLHYFLETDEIVYIEDGITHSYTIPMVNLDKPSRLVNLLLSSENGEEYDMYIVEYNINEEEQLRLMTGEYIDLKNKITFTKTDEIGSVIQYRTIGSADDCTTITYVPGVCASGQHQYGDLRCDYLNPPQIDKMAPPFQNIIISYTEDCGGSGAPSPGESETNPNPTNPGSGTGGGSSSIKNPSNTTPLALSNYSKFVFNLNILGRQDIIDYLENEQNEEIEQQIKNYLNTTGFILGGGSAEEQNAEKFEFVENLIQLDIELENNPSFLLEVPYTQLQKWQELVQHQVPQSIINKIRILDQNGSFGDFQIQYLEEAKGNVINLDYFSVNITSLPNNPQTGVQFSPEGFLNHIRLNISNFINTDYSEFSPSTITGMNEAQIWNSNDPLSAIIHINIPTPAGDGSVICSQYTNSSWIFTTIEVPWRPFSQGYDGIHPVSGHRQFGIVQNSNGNYTVFTRGADRMTDRIESFFAENFIPYPFEAPDDLWNSFREGVYNFINGNGGNASSLNSNPPEIWRPDWDKVKDVLKGLRPISDLEAD